MKIDEFEEFFNKAGVPFKKAGKTTLIVSRTHFLFNPKGVFTGVADGTAGAVSAPTTEKTKVPSRFAPSTAPQRPRKAPVKKEMPWQLEHALECDEDGEHEFVQDCLRQWEEKNWLSENQLDALGRWKAKGDRD